MNLSNDCHYIRKLIRTKSMLPESIERLVVETHLSQCAECQRHINVQAPNLLGQLLNTPPLDQLQPQNIATLDQPQLRNIRPAPDQPQPRTVNLIKPLRILRTHLKNWGWTYIIILFTALLPLLPLFVQPTNTLLTKTDGTVSSDTYNYLYMLLRFAMNAGSQVNPFFDPTQNYPDGLDLISIDIPWLMYWMIPPSLVLVSPIFAFNMLILESHILTGITTAYWAYVLGVRNHFALRLGAIAAILLPFRAMHAIDHPNIVTTQFVVLWFLALEWWLQATTHRNRHYYVLAIVTFLLTANSFQYTFICMVLSIIYVGVRLHITQFADINRYSRYVGVRLYITQFAEIGKYYRLVSSVVIGGTIGAFPLLRSQHVNLRQFSAYESSKFSASLSDYLIPSPLSLWQKLHLLPVDGQVSSEQVLYIGAITTLFALLGIPCIPRRSRWSIIGTITFGLLLSLGTRINAPQQLIDQWPLPAQLLQTMGLGAFRAWARFGGVVALSLCVCAAFGIEYILKRTQKQQIQFFMVGALMIGITVDTLPLYRTTSVPANSELTNQLAILPPNAVVMFVPNVASRSIADTLYQTRFQLLQQFTIQHMVSYGHSAHWPNAYTEFERDMRRIEDPVTSTVLCRKGVTHLVINNRLWQRTPAFAQNKVMNVIATTQYWQIIQLQNCN